MNCDKTDCKHYKVCEEWESLGNDNYINDSYGNCDHYSMSYDSLSDLVSREALIREIGRTDEWYKGRSICNIIDNAPTVQAFTLEDMQNNFDAGVDSVIGKYDKAEGEWIPQGGGFSWVFKCSCCGWVDGYPLNERHKYCPNCGAEMRKGGAE